MSLLSVEHVAIGYGGTLAVFDANLSVEPGRFVTLIGPNGAGKTTLLLSCAGFLKPSAGQVTFAGQDVARMSPHKLVRHGVGFVPDDRALIPGLTVVEALSLVRDPSMSALELFPELERLGNRRVGLLSGGEQQMLALARVLITRPKLLLIDELSLGLAPLVVTRLLGAVREAADRFGTGVLLVEQQVEQALAVADDAYVMVHGRVVLSGSAGELLGRREELEASYLGIKTAEAVG